jgi:hypothetical protein
MRILVPMAVLSLLAAACDEKTYAGYDAVEETEDPEEESADIIRPEPEPPPDECEDPDPPPHGPRVDFDVDCEPCCADAEPGLECNVADVNEVMPGHVIVTLNCRCPSGSAVYQVETFSDIPARLALFGGESVIFRFFEFGPAVAWTPWFFSLKRDTGQLMLAGIDATYARPRGEPGDWYDPVEVELVAGLCEPVSYDCYDLERVALHVTYDEYETWVFDSQTATIGYTEPYFVQVDNAEILTNHSCSGIAPARFMFLIMRIPEI